MRRLRLSQACGARSPLSQVAKSFENIEDASRAGAHLEELVDLTERRTIMNISSVQLKKLKKRNYVIAAPELNY